MVLGLFLVALFAPLLPPPPASGLIRFSELDRVRVECPGFVEEILVKDGQRVEKGDVLFRLSNPAEEARAAQLFTEARRSESLALKFGRERRRELQAREAARAKGYHCPSDRSARFRLDTSGSLFASRGRRWIRAR